MPPAPEITDEAWVTLATNDTYALGALVLGHSLRRFNTKRGLVVMVSPQVSPNMRGILADVYNEVKDVNVLDSNDRSNLALIERPDLGVTFTKLHCWRLTQYSKGVFLDADTMVMQNCDELFEHDELSAAPDCGWPDCFNSGVFVFKPSEETYQSLLNFALTHGSFDGGDQGLLNLFFHDWSRKDIKKHLPFVYNMVATATYSYLPAVKQFGKDVKIVHFLGATKPWMHQYDPVSGKVSVSGEAHQHAHAYLTQWWDLFGAEVLPRMTGDYGLIDNIYFMASLRSILPSWMIYNENAEAAYRETLVASEAAPQHGQSAALFIESFQPDSYVWHEFSKQQEPVFERPPSPVREPEVHHHYEHQHHHHEPPRPPPAMEPEEKFPWGEFRHERFTPDYIIEKRQEHDHHQHHHHHHHESWHHANDYGIPVPIDSFGYGESLPEPVMDQVVPEQNNEYRHEHNQQTSWNRGNVWDVFPVGGPNLREPIYNPVQPAVKPDTREQFEKSDKRRPMIWHLHPIGGPKVPLEKRISRHFKKSKSRLEAEKKRVAEAQRRRVVEAEAQEVKDVETLKRENLFGLKFTKTRRVSTKVQGSQSDSPYSFSSVLTPCSGMFRGKAVKLVNGSPVVVKASEILDDNISADQKMFILPKARSSRVPVTCFGRASQTELELLEDLVPVLMSIQLKNEFDFEDLSVSREKDAKEVFVAVDVNAEEDESEANEVPEVNGYYSEATKQRKEDDTLENEEDTVQVAELGANRYRSRAEGTDVTTKTVYNPSDYVPMSSSDLVDMLKQRATVHAASTAASTASRISAQPPSLQSV